MKQVSKLIQVLLFTVLILLSTNAFSQIIGVDASYRSETIYSSAPQDSIYVFCDNIGTGVGQITSSSPDGNSGWTFTWTKWDSGTSDFTIPVTVEVSQSVSSLTNLTDGLYKVVVSKSGETDFEDQAWVLNNTNANPTFALTLLDCVGVHFTSEFTPNDIEYNDIYASDVTDMISVMDVTTDRTIKFSLLKGGVEFRTAPEELGVIPYTLIDKTFIDPEAFEGEETYVVTVLDQYGCEFTSDAIQTPTYAVKADFTVEPMSGEAALEVAFTNRSINADDYEWFIYQDFDRLEDNLTMVEDSLLVDGVLIDETPIPYTYMHPGNYFVKLIVSSDKGPETCIDEFYLLEEDMPIIVDTSLVEVPNVFTPNGDGQNDIFRVKSQSLKSFHAIVFNRWGKLVYEWKNAEDGGWNGKINGKWATPGTYFYVITATGREELKKKYTKKGSFMLIRN